MPFNLSKFSGTTDTKVDTNPNTEAKLWQDFKSGDAASFALIYQKFFPVLFAYGTKISNDPEIVKDSIQDLFIYIWNHRRTVADTDSIKYYLGTALKRRIVRMMANQQDISLEEIYQLDVAEEGIDYRLINEEVSREKKEKIFWAMQSLTKRQQQAINLKFFHNLKNEEIAERMSIGIESVYNLISKSLILLRKVSIKSTVVLLLANLLLK